jgi:hypothetical protein
MIKHQFSALGFALTLASASLLGGCASSNMNFHPIEPRATASISKIYVNQDLGAVGQGKDATINGGINLDVFRAQIMSSTGIRFVESSADATIQISFGNNTQKAFLYYFDKHWEQYYTMRITENSGRIIYVTDGILVGQSSYEQALEMNRMFVEKVIPVLQGKSAAIDVSYRVASL